MVVARPWRAPRWTIPGEFAMLRSFTNRFLPAALLPVALVLGASGSAAEDKKQDAKQLEVDLGKGIKMKLVRIEAGKFTMGASTKAERATIQNNPEDKEIDQETPHEVEITKPFYMGVYVVTQAEYACVMATNPSYFSATGRGKAEVAGLDTARFPVESVSWADAVEFCKKLSTSEKKTFDLPTEAEWEYACRAGSKTAFHFGDALSSKQANIDGTRPHGGAAQGPWLKRPAPVGSFEPNAFGLYDMHGNVRQCCKDWHARDYYDKSPVRDPQGPDTGTARVARGGSWFDAAWFCRSAYRFGTPPDDRLNYIQGFRVVVLLP
jgi:formylglycine-generating enzyme required for sulfatase activity